MAASSPRPAVVVPEAGSGGMHYPEEERGRRSINPLKTSGVTRTLGLGLAFLETGTALFVAVWSGVLFPDTRLNDLSVNSLSEQTYSYQLAASIVGLALSVAALVCVCSGFHRTSTRLGPQTGPAYAADNDLDLDDERAHSGAPQSSSAPLFLATLLYFCKLLLSFALFANPTTIRLVAVIIGVVLQFLGAFAFLAIGVNHANWAATFGEDPSQGPYIHPLHADLELQRVLRSFSAGSGYLALLLTILIALMTSTAVVQLSRLDSSQSPELDPAAAASLLDKLAGDAGRMNKSGIMPNSLEYAPRHTPYKQVAMVLISGLRYDQSAPLQALFDKSDSPFYEDSVYGAARAEIPSNSLPNWLTILSGATPSLTGVLGQRGCPPSNTRYTPYCGAYSTVFTMAREFNLVPIVSASPQLTALVKDDLTPMYGDASVGLGRRLQTQSAVDYRRFNVLSSVLDDQWGESSNTSTSPSSLFVLELSEPEYIANDFGVTRRYSDSGVFTGSQASYKSAVLNKTALVEALLTGASNDTVIIVVSDHGNENAGGHGGGGDNGNNLTRVPLGVYCRGSALRSKAASSSSSSSSSKDKKSAEHDYGQDSFYSSGQMPSVSDLAPSISALLGVPVPPQSMGVFLNQILPLLPDPTSDAYTSAYADLFLQQRDLIVKYIESKVPECAVSPSAYPCPSAYGSNKYLNRVACDAASECSVKELKKGIVDMRRAFDVIRANGARTAFAVAFTLSVVALLLVVGAALAVLQKATFASPAGGCGARVPYIRAGRSCTGLSADCAALLYGVLVFVAYYLCVIVTYLIVYEVSYGQVLWSSSVMRLWGFYPVTKFAMTCLTPGTIVALTLFRCFRVQCMGPPQDGDGNTAVASTLDKCIPLCTDTDSMADYRYLDTLYLFTHYTAFLSVFVIMTLFVLAADFTFFVPYFLEGARLVDGQLWDLRFRVLSVMFMSLPLLVISLLALTGLPSLNRVSYSSQFQLFALYLVKRGADEEDIQAWEGKLLDERDLPEAPRRGSPRPASPPVVRQRSKVAAFTDDDGYVAPGSRAVGMGRNTLGKPPSPRTVTVSGRDAAQQGGSVPEQRPLMMAGPGGGVGRSGNAGVQDGSGYITRGGSDEEGVDRLPIAEMHHEFVTIDDDPNPLRMGSLRNFLALLLFTLTCVCIILLTSGNYN